MAYLQILQVRLLINSTVTEWHSQVPYVGVTDCSFYGSDPSRSDDDPITFGIIGENGCISPPSFYNPFEAAAATAKGMYLNEQPNKAGTVKGRAQGQP